MKRLLSIGGLFILSTAFVCGATNVEWEWKTDSSSLTKCISVSLDGDEVGQVKIQWENGGAYEDVFVTTGTEISSVCHEYSTAGKYSANMEVLSGKNKNGDSIANDLSYLGFLNQKVTNITKLDSQTLDYFVLKEAATDKLSDEQYKNITKNFNIPKTTQSYIETNSNSNNNNTSSSGGGSSRSTGGGGGGSSSTKTTETKKEQTTSTGSVNKTEQETQTTKTTSTKKNKTPTILSNNYNEEVKNAYIWAYENDITSIDVLENARAGSELLRGQMAKILVNYAVNILGKEIPGIPSYCSWDDDEDWPTDEMRTYGKMACALGIMGINVSSFEPMRQVSRAQFGTALSRLLWGDAYNVQGEIYYERHLNALKSKGYIDKIDNPKERTEIRQWVWVMLERTANDNSK